MKKIIFKLFILLTLLTALNGTHSVKAQSLPDYSVEGKVVICHATNAHTNPYTTNDVDTSSADETNNQYLNGHGDHTGDVWYEGIADHSWGDIIPPFYSPEGTYFSGLNWNTVGEAIWDNNCNIPEPTATPTPTPTPEDEEPSATPTPTPTPDATPTPTPTSTPNNNDDDGNDNDSSSPDSNNSSENNATGGVVEPELEGQILGASTYATTGWAEDVMMTLAGFVGSVLNFTGIKMYAKNRKNK